MVANQGAASGRCILRLDVGDFLFGAMLSSHTAW